MDKRKKAKLITSILDELYPDPAVPLHYKDHYTLLIAVLLSAQCTDARVNLTTPQLFALADTPEKMAQVPVEAIQQIIRPCGLSSSKARAIKQLSMLLIERHHSQVP